MILPGHDQNYLRDNRIDIMNELYEYERLTGNRWGPYNVDQWPERGIDTAAEWHAALKAAIAEAKEDRPGKANELPRDLAAVPTCELVEELRRREGVEATIAEPYEDVAVSVNGPAIVMVVID